MTPNEFFTMLGVSFLIFAGLMLLLTLAPAPRQDGEIRNFLFGISGGLSIAGVVTLLLAQIVVFT